LPTLAEALEEDVGGEACSVLAVLPDVAAATERVAADVTIVLDVGALEILIDGAAAVVSAATATLALPLDFAAAGVSPRPVTAE